MEKTLTIVVPSYNTQEYIDTCIPTMLAHPYAGMLELLLVNDGSTDRTLEKLSRYGRRHPDTVTVIDKANGGHGSVINEGIRRARGRYFKVVDGDDWVLPENLGRMIRDLSGCHADLAIHPYIRYHTGKREGKAVRFPIRKNRLLQFDGVAQGLKEVGIHAATYRTALLRDHHIRVRENCFYEDTEYNIYPIPYVRTVRAYGYPVYVYRTGAAAQSINPGQAFQNRAMHSRVVWDCIAWYGKNRAGLTEGKRAYVRRVINRRIRSQYMVYLKNHITAAQLGELERWDRELGRRSASFYHGTNRFPLSFLRMGVRRTYPAVRLLYMLYAGLH